VGAELFSAHGRTDGLSDTTMLIVTFQSSANRLISTTNGICHIVKNGGGTFFNGRINMKQ